MEIRYINQRGSVCFSGSGSGAGLHMISVSGLDLPERERSLVNYAGQDGVRERTGQYSQRTITIYGDWSWDAVSKSDISRIAQILSGTGTLNILGTEKVRVITANAASLTLGEQKGNYQQFCVQLTCDFPHFTDPDKQEQTLYQRINQITKDSMLPAVLTVRINDIYLENPGNVAAEPVLIFTGGISKESSGEITIENRTTGKAMQIQHALAPDELLRLDVPNRELISSVHGDITEKITQDSFFSELYLQPGENQIHLRGTGGNLDMQCVMEYQPLYTEAIV